MKLITNYLFSAFYYYIRLTQKRREFLNILCSKNLMYIIYKLVVGQANCLKSSWCYLLWSRSTEKKKKKKESPFLLTIRIISDQMKGRSASHRLSMRPRRRSKHREENGCTLLWSSTSKVRDEIKKNIKSQISQKNILQYIVFRCSNWTWAVDLINLIIYVRSTKLILCKNLHFI